MKFVLTSLILGLFLLNCLPGSSTTSNNTFFHQNRETVILYASDGKETHRWVGVHRLLLNGSRISFLDSSDCRIHIINSPVIIVPDNYVLPKNGD